MGYIRPSLKRKKKYGPVLKEKKKFVEGLDSGAQLKTEGLCVCCLAGGIPACRER